MAKNPKDAVADLVAASLKFMNAYEVGRQRESVSWEDLDEASIDVRSALKAWKPTRCRVCGQFFVKGLARCACD